jgi:anti-sigma B factor antagonist
MDITTTPYKHCDLVKVTGRIDSATSPKLGETLDMVVENGKYKIVLDLSEVDFISSAGMRELITAQKICKRYNRGELILATVPEKIYYALDLAGFTKLFRISDDVVSAVGSL